MLENAIAILAHSNDRSTFNKSDFANVDTIKNEA